MLRIVFVAAALVATVDAAQAETAFAPLAFLAGSCWEGQFADGKAVDRHCFRWVFEGKILRDRHRVRAGAEAPPSPTDYKGETIYSIDPKAKGLIYRYFNGEGEVIDGRVEAAGGKIVFPSVMETSAGPVRIRAIWTPAGPDAYESTEEQYKNGKWERMFSRTMRRVGPASTEPEFP
jgi:hypothetical protein